MSKAKDVEQNERLLHQMVEQLDPKLSALVGFHALTELAHTMTPDKFGEWLQNAVGESQQTHADFVNPSNQNPGPNP